MARTRVQSRRFWAIAISRRPRFTRTSPTCTCVRLTIDFIRGRGSEARASARASFAKWPSLTVGLLSQMEVTRTYLEMRAPADFRPARNDDPLIKIELQPDCSGE